MLLVIEEWEKENNEGGEAGMKVKEIDAEIVVDVEVAIKDGAKELEANAEENQEANDITGDSEELENHTNMLKQL